MQANKNREPKALKTNRKSQEQKEKDEAPLKN